MGDEGSKPRGEQGRVVFEAAVFLFLLVVGECGLAVQGPPRRLVVGGFGARCRFALSDVGDFVFVVMGERGAVVALRRSVPRS